MRVAIPWLCLCLVLRGATGNTEPQLSAFDDFMNGLLAKWRISGAALGVAHHGRLVMAHGYGVLEGGLPVEPDSLFRIAGLPQADGSDFQSTVLSPLGLSRMTLSPGEWQASVIDLLRLVSALDGSRPSALPKAMNPTAAEWLIRPVGQAASGVEVVLLFRSRPADAAFDSEVSAGVTRAANSIRQWPATDLFVQGPEIFERDIVNAADYSNGKVAPGEIVVLFPSNAGPATVAGSQVGSDGRIETTAGETRVLFDGVPGPMAYSASGQVASVVPYGVAGQKTTGVQVEYQGVRSPAVTVPVVESSPAMFTLDASGKGQAAILNSTGCCNSVSNPAVRGTLVALYATGGGQTIPRGIDGDLSGYDRIADLPTPRLKVQVTVGGRPAEIDWAGSAPHAVAGLLQVNFRVPVDAPTGDAVPVVLSVGEAHSPDGVTMAIRQDTYRVLVLDPDTAVRARLAGVLKGGGYEVVAARSPQDALAEAKQHPIDMVIVSLALPEPGLQDMVRTIAAERRLLKIVATSATLGAGPLRVADLLGAQAVFPKPLDTAKLLRRVHELLELHPVPYVATEDVPSLRFPDLRIRR